MYTHHQWPIVRHNMGSFLGFNKMLWFLFQFHDSFTIFSPFQTLLDLGASPNYKDAQGLTPLYHCVCHSTNPHVAESLLHDHSLLGIQDEQGWAEVHQVSRQCFFSAYSAISTFFRGFLTPPLDQHKSEE